ncbi:unnamed protein product [Albugo candida]|uniref:PWWP domain-containing protein n=1 Tax=Albugo candida TaxID=65357 RepID=A0A024G3S8_9STRA|nr:unnamed protein product [Albugo candida]|eukprot:CCI41326.1 unnamed protein product [Albugo candida]
MSDKGHIATEESVASTPTIVEKDAPNENKVVLERHSPEKVKEENTNGTNRLTETKTESPKNLSKTTASIDKTPKSSKYKSENEEDTESDLEPQKKKIKRANTGSAAKTKASNTSRKRKAAASLIAGSVEVSDIHSRVLALPQEIKDMFGQLVWAKMQGYPYWPALVVDPRHLPSSQQKQAIRSFETSKYWVFFYRARNFGPVPFKSVEKWLDTNQKYREGFPVGAAKAPKRRKELMGAIEDADVDYKRPAIERASDFLEVSISYVAMSVRHLFMRSLQHTGTATNRTAKANTISAQQGSKDQVETKKKKGRSTPTNKNPKPAGSNTKNDEKFIANIPKPTYDNEAAPNEAKSKSNDKVTPNEPKPENDDKAMLNEPKPKIDDKAAMSIEAKFKSNDKATPNEPKPKNENEAMPNASVGDEEQIGQQIEKQKESPVETQLVCGIVEDKNVNESSERLPSNSANDKAPSNYPGATLKGTPQQTQSTTQTPESKSDFELKNAQEANDSTKLAIKEKELKSDVAAHTLVARETESDPIDWIIFGKRLISLSEDEAANHDELLLMLSKVFEAKKITKVDIEKSGVAPVISKLRKSTNPSLAQTAKSLRKYLIASLNKDLKVQDIKCKSKQSTMKCQDSSLAGKSDVKERMIGQSMEEQTENGDSKKDAEKVVPDGTTDAEQIGDEMTKTSRKPDQLDETTRQSDKLHIQDDARKQLATSKATLEPPIPCLRNVDSSRHVEELRSKESILDAVASIATNGELQKQTSKDIPVTASVVSAGKAELVSGASKEHLKSSDTNLEGNREVDALTQESKKDEYRVRVIEMLTMSLGDQYGNLAKAIEQCIYDRFTESNDLYRAHARLVTFTLKDDEKLRNRVVGGSIHGFELAYANKDFFRQTRTIT